MPREAGLAGGWLSPGPRDPPADPLAGRAALQARCSGGGSSKGLPGGQKEKGPRFRGPQRKEVGRRCMGVLLGDPWPGKASLLHPAAGYLLPRRPRLRSPCKNQKQCHGRAFSPLDAPSRVIYRASLRKNAAPGGGGCLGVIVSASSCHLYRDSAGRFRARKWTARGRVAFRRSNGGLPACFGRCNEDPRAGPEGPFFPSAHVRRDGRFQPGMGGRLRPPFPSDHKHALDRRSGGGTRGEAGGPVPAKPLKPRAKPRCGGMCVRRNPGNDPSGRWAGR